MLAGIDGIPAGFTARRLLSRRGAVAVLAGEWWGRPAVCKLAVGGNLTAASTLTREIKIYEYFQDTPPPLGVPKLLAADAGLGTLVLEHVSGRQLGIRRVPENIELAPLSRLLAEIRTFDTWAGGRAVAANLAVDYPTRLSRIYAELERAERATLMLVAQRAADAQPTLGHGGLDVTNCLVSDAGFTYVGWGAAAGYLPGFDLALLWVTLGLITGPRRAIQDIVVTQPPAYRASFWLNVTLLLARELRGAAGRDSLTGTMFATTWERLRANGFVGVD